MIIVALLLTSCLEAQLVPTNEDNYTKNLKEVRALWSASSLLRSTAGGDGNGFAEVKLYDDKNIHLAMRLNLPDLDEGEYVACIERSSPPSRIRLSVLTKSENGSYSLKYQEKVGNLTKYGDLGDYDKIIVIHETPEGERPVLGGKLVMTP